jgi:hypothetical protein
MSDSSLPSGPAVMHGGNPGARGSELRGPETGTSGTAARDRLALALDGARLGVGVALAITVAKQHGEVNPMPGGRPGPASSAFSHRT